MNYLSNATTDRSDSQSESTSTSANEIMIVEGITLSAIPIVAVAWVLF